MLETPIIWHRLTELPFSELFGAHGLYVLWDSRDEERPSYIGSGKLLTHLARRFRRENMKGCPRPDGYAGIVGMQNDESVGVYTEAIKHLLLDVAADVGRLPRSKRTYSSPEALLDLLRQHGSYSVSFHRHDPLMSPSSVLPLKDARTIVAWTLDRDDYWIEHRKMIPASYYRA